MRDKLLHIFRNNSFGREILLQSIYFCKKGPAAPTACTAVSPRLNVFLPGYWRFLMYWGTKVVTVELDNESLRSQETAPEHAEEIIRTGGLTPDFIQLLPVWKPDHYFEVELNGKINEK